MILRDLWVGWLKIGFFGFGGGPSVIPLIRAESVSHYQWLSDTQFLDLLALGNSLPGPIAVKMAVGIGRQAAGWAGAGVALLGLCLPGVGMMVLLSSLFLHYKEHPAVAGMLRSARAAAVGMLVWTAWELAPDGVKDLPSGILAVVALGALLLGVHPAWVIAGAVGVGAVGFR